MDLSPEMIKAGTDLATYAGKTSTVAIWDKIRAVKNKGNQDEIINNFEEIINELISDKNQLIQISQAYEEQLIAQKISDEDVEYITEQIVPLFEEILDGVEGDDASKVKENIKTVKPILSKETFNILQLLGFNFKKAFGEPLTKLVNESISAKIPVSSEKNADYQMLLQQREIEYLKLAQDEEAFQRYLQLIGQE